MTHSVGDKPIETFDQDELGHVGFARKLAERVTTVIEASEETGFVISLTGQWGSGKTSIINLLRLAINEAEVPENNNKIEVTEISCLWVQNQGAIIERLCHKLEHIFVGGGWSKFFVFLSAALGFLATLLSISYLIWFVDWEVIFASAKEGNIPSLGEILTIIVPASLLSVYGSLSSFIKFLASKGCSIFSIWSASKEASQASVEMREGKFELFVDRLKEQASKSKSKHLIVLDDLDRLPVDEVFFVLRAVAMMKAIPRTVFLLSFDEQLVNDLLRERFPSEQNLFSDKIIQVPFSIPDPGKASLEHFFNLQLKDLAKSAEDAVIDFDDARIIYPLIQTPRDIVRIKNFIYMFAGAGGGANVFAELNRDDLLILATLKVKWFELYEAIRRNRTLLVGVSDDSMAELASRIGSADSALQNKLELLGFPDDEEAKKILLRLFPLLNDHHGDGTSILINADREYRIQSRKYFATYFSLELPNDALPRKEVESIKKKSFRPQEIKTFLSKELKESDKSRGWRFDLIMDELNEHSAELNEQQTKNLLVAIFEMSDEIVKYYQNLGKWDNDCLLNLHFLVNACLQNRFQEEMRDEIFRAAMSKGRESSALIFTSALAIRSYRHHNEGTGLTLCSKQCAYKEFEATLNALSQSIEEYIESPFFYRLLMIWSAAPDGSGAVQNWLSAKMMNDSFIENLAAAFIMRGWSPSSEGSTQHYRKAICPPELIDEPVFLARLKDVFSQERPNQSLRHPNVRLFLELWNHPANNDVGVPDDEPEKK